VSIAVIVLVGVLAGGMRSITFVQAFQYWLKLTALALPAVFVLVMWRADGLPELAPPEEPVFAEATEVDVHSDVTIEVTEPVVVRGDGAVDGRAVDGEVRLSAGDHEVHAGTSLTFPTGSAVPHAAPLNPMRGLDWALPLHGDEEYPLYSTYSLILALFFGTMGLPHVLVRFYTNPDGRAARRTTLTVLGLLGVFYLLPTVYGALGRFYTPELLVTGRTDAVVLVLPGRLVGGAWGDLLSALVTSGAFAAFLSTSSGLTVSVAGVFSQDLLRRFVRRPVTSFRVGAVLALLVPITLSLTSPLLGIADVVGLAFAVAASSFSPLLLLGIWWRRLTDVGAVAGLITGGALSTAAVVATIVWGRQDGWVAATLASPAAWSMPMAFVVMVVVSLATQRRIAPGVDRTMVRLHTPENINVDRGDWDPEDRWRREPPAIPPQTL
jgi:Na+(H+)/acetate symporter ActP